MSKQFLKEVFSKLTECEAWVMQIVQVKNTVKYGTTYICREVQFSPARELIDYIESISDYYLSKDGIDDFTSVDNYTGDVVDHVIYKLKSSDQLITNEFEKLIESSGQPDRETPIKGINSNAAIFKGTVKVDHNDFPVILVSMQRPITALSNKFLLFEGSSFHKIDEPVLSLRKTIDVAIIGDSVYLFTLAGEKLFNMERTYKAVAKHDVEEIIKCDFLSNEEKFQCFANSGRNPRRFVSYNESHFKWLKDSGNRARAAEKFGLVLDGNSIRTDDEESVEKLVKFLCNKAMLDPCDDSPVEVAATKPWR